MSPGKFVETWFEEIWNKGNSDFVRKHLCPDCIIHGLPPEANGIEGFIQFQQTMLNTIKNLHIEIVEATEEGSKVVGIARVTGQYFSDDSSVDFNFGFSTRIENDMVMEARNVVDFMSFLQQTGKLGHQVLNHALNL